MARLRLPEPAKTGHPLVDAIIRSTQTDVPGPGALAIRLGAPVALQPLTGMGQGFRFPLIEAGKEVGDALLSRIGKTLHVDMIARRSGQAPLKPSDMHAMLRQLLQMPEFQGIEKVSGTRITGMAAKSASKAAGEAGSTTTVFPEIEIPIARLMRRLLESAGESVAP